ncbi:hypothetical protein [Parabacteroides sp. FAFU027]|uniref:hypothetical protein n=1 Tax=Parabacteroides sp. FAFU027 TaxID=2922715 RepID=UPI001FAF79C7|nr:hypothetical protein [Parabacteroides sp. FAFU027]
MKFTIIYLCILLFSGTFFAQTSDSIYQQYLLNNKNVPKRVYYTDNSQNILKTNIFSLLDGHLPIIWEHRFDNNMGFELGPGIILPYTFSDIIGQKQLEEIYKPNFPFILNPDFSNKKLGVSFHLEPKLYLGSSPWGSLGTFYSFKSYSKMWMNQIGLAFNFIDEYPSSKKYATQMGITFSYVNQIPYYNIADVRYTGTSYESLSGHGLPMINCFLLAFRFQPGYIFENQIKPRK